MPGPAFSLVELADQFEQLVRRGVNMGGQFGDPVFDFAELMVRDWGPGAGWKRHDEGP